MPDPETYQTESYLRRQLELGPVRRSRSRYNDGPHL